MGALSFLKSRAAKRIGLEHRQFAAMTATLLDGTSALCPHCRRGHLRPVPEAPAMRDCDDPHCGVRYAMADMGQTMAVSGMDLAELATHERRQAMMLFVAAEVVGVVAAAWAIYSGSWGTLFGAVLLCVVLCATATVARYRAWQLESGRMFEARAPFGSFLAWEVERLVGRSR